ncbi:MAG: glycosyltransferase [Vicinamibacterales bacterium]
MYSLHLDTAKSWRGGQNQVLLTVLGLRALGHRALLVAHPLGELRRRADEGLDLLPLAPRTELDVAAAWKLARVIRRERPDIVHAHDPHGVAMAAWALALGVGEPAPLLVASRRVDFDLKQNAFSRWKYRQVRAFLCASTFIRDMLVRDGIEPARAITVHEGVDLEHIARVPPLDVHSEFHLPHGAPVVANIAALAPHKGQRYFVEAAHRVVQSVPDARFLIVGEGELHAALQKQVHEHTLERHVHLTGFRRDALAILKDVDIFVMCSITEGLGTSTLDAMACRKPVVASRVGGIPEVVVDGDTGVLVAPRDPDALARAIVSLLESPERRRAMSDAGFARVTERFGVDRMVRETAAVYEQLVGEGRPVGTPA